MFFLESLCFLYNPKSVGILINLIIAFEFQLGSPGGSDGKASALNAEDAGSIPGWKRSPGEGNSNPFQYTCLENFMDGGDWWATVNGVAKNRTRLSNFTR